MSAKFLKNKKRRHFLFNMEKKAVYGFFLFHILASQILLPYMDKREIFPIFQWSLFSKCDSHGGIYEMEVSYVKGEEEIFLTNRKFPSHLQNNFLNITRKIFIAEDSGEKEHFKRKLSHEISHFLNKKSFSYKIFESEVNFVEYERRDSIEREALLMAGDFKL